MRVAAVQYKARREDLDASVRGLVDLAEQAAKDVDLLVLPEMAVTGYTFPDRTSVVQAARQANGRTLAALQQVAKQAGAWLVAGFPEIDGDRLFNSAWVLRPDGSCAFVYRKTLLYTEDLHWATPGDSGYRVFDTGNGTFIPAICMDLNDDHFIRWCAGQAVDCVALSTNWLDEDEEVWPYWAWRTEPTGAALVAANTWGSEGDVRFRGHSAVIEGRVVRAGAPRTGDGWISATLLGVSDALPEPPVAL